MFDVDSKVRAVLRGELEFNRFSRQEQNGSRDLADRLLWTGILLAEREMAESDARASGCRKNQANGDAPSPYRFLEAISQPLPATLNDLAFEIGAYEDRGQESIVCNSGDGYVNKLRIMRPSIISGYMAPLANIVYHNCIFKNERYWLENIYSGQGKYFMVLRQQRVEILLDGEGYPVRPNAKQICDAIDDLDVGLIEYESEEEDFSSDDSSSGESTNIRFYNADYYISDLQPGRNTVIDANSGRVRFIDPRIILNDPQGPITPVSKYGRRREDIPGQLFVL